MRITNFLDLFFLGPYRGEGEKYSRFSKNIVLTTVEHINEAFVHLDSAWNLWEEKGVQPTSVLTVLFYYTSRWIRSVRSALILLARGYHHDSCIVIRHSIGVYADLEYLIQNNKCADWAARKMIDRHDFRRTR